MSWDKCNISCAVLNDTGWCLELVRVPVKCANTNDLFHILRCLLHLEFLTCMWNYKSKGQFLQEFLSLLFLTFSKVGYIFSENNKCVQGSAVNYSIKEPHWPTVCFSCRGVQAAHLIMTVHAKFFLVVKYVYFFFFNILVSLFSECIVDRKTTLLFFFGTTDNRVKLFAWSNVY